MIINIINNVAKVCTAKEYYIKREIYSRSLKNKTLILYLVIIKF